MSLIGKLELETEIKSPAAKFHDVFRSRPHHISNICPEKIQGCALHDGDWGNAGSVIFWNYVHEGKASTIKEIIEAIDDENNSMTFKVIDGDVLAEHKSFKIIVVATPKGKGCVVRWIFEYEKLNANVPDPKTLIEFLINITKDIDAHLCQQA